MRLRGVVVLGPSGGAPPAAAWARFYMEPVEETGDGVDATVRSRVGIRG
jgi:hypothetical protein